MLASSSRSPFALGPSSLVPHTIAPMPGNPCSSPEEESTSSTMAVCISLRTSSPSGTLHATTSPLDPARRRSGPPPPGALSEERESTAREYTAVASNPSRTCSHSRVSDSHPRTVPSTDPEYSMPRRAARQVTGLRCPHRMPSSTRPSRSHTHTLLSKHPTAALVRPPAPLKTQRLLARGIGASLPPKDDSSVDAEGGRSGSSPSGSSFPSSFHTFTLPSNEALSTRAPSCHKARPETASPCASLIWRQRCAPSASHTRIVPSEDPLKRLSSTIKSASTRPECPVKVALFIHPSRTEPWIVSGSSPLSAAASVCA
mmetsp:Transcript_43950/g.103991  ORF Transcript_43950/g.103991 Transcript_43950/m.103991 type:complete len:315 (+) Transcript_43950:81-1025(+)